MLCRISDLLELSDKYDPLVEKYDLLEIGDRSVPKDYKPFKYKKTSFQRKDPTLNTYKNTTIKDERFTRNRKLRDQDATFEYSEYLIEEFYKCRRDILYFAENYVNIFNTGFEKPIKFQPRGYQRLFLRSLADNRFNVSNQSRQTGKSICVSIFIAWIVTFHSNRGCGIVNKEHAAAKKNLKDCIKILEGLPCFLSVGVVSLSTDRVEFENGSFINTHASTPDAFNGQSYYLSWLDEYALQPQGRELLEGGILPVTSSNKQSKVVITSTPRGKTHFYEICKAGIKYEDITEEQSQDEDFNEWIVLTVKWWENPDNSFEKRVTSDFPFYEYRFNSTHSNKFAKGMIKKQGLEKFRQEYECEFLAGDHTLVSLEKLDAYRQHLFACKAGEYEICYGGVKMYQEGQKHMRYVVTVDPCIGGTNSDNFAISVWGLTENKGKGVFVQVASYAEPNIDIYKGAEILENLSEEYFYPVVVIESNGTGSNLISHILREHEDIRLYHCNGKYGVNTNAKTKNPSLDLFKHAFNNGEIAFLDLDLITELEHFSASQANPTKFAAEKNYHDDRVMTVSVLFQAIANGNVYQFIRGII